MYVTLRRDGAWELRQSLRTEAGPRSRTLARFRVLTPEVLAHATSRAGGELEQAAVRRAAERAGAPIAGDAVTVATQALLADIAQGKGPPPHWRRILATVLAGDAGPSRLLDTERAALRWVSATPAERGRALVDLLALADAIPASPARAGSPRPRLRYPPLSGHRDGNVAKRT